MSLLSDWREFAYQNHDDRTADGKKFWQGYFDQEKAVYEEILADPDHPVSGTVAELADKYREAGIRRTEELSLEAAAAKWAEEAEKHSPRMIRNKKGYQAAGAAIGQLPDDNTEDNI